MLNNINDIKKLIDTCMYHDYGTLECLFDKYSSFIEENKINWRKIETLITYESRYYTIERNVYEFFKDGKSIGFLGIEEVGTLKSESMGYNDCCVDVIAYNVREIVKKSFEIIKEEV